LRLTRSSGSHTELQRCSLLPRFYLQLSTTEISART
ncbi:hypothetical protein GCK32_022015, partial [Trichostrongylus colubriformis]